MNTNIDNYMDSLEEWTTIDFEWEDYKFIKHSWDYMICEDGKYLIYDDFIDDLEFWDNSKFKEWIVNQEVDKQTNSWMDLAREGKL